MQEVKISSVGDYLKFRSNEDWDARKPAWFRGHASASWNLIPGYYRAERTISETSLLARFKQSAAMLAELQPKDAYDWLFLMQHYGVPTRLLDWSESPLVALYFAVAENREDHPEGAALWRLDPTELNKHASIVNQDEEYYIPSFEDEELKGYTPESVTVGRKMELYPVATLATRNNARIQAQMGTFTIHHNKQISLEDVGNGSHVTKFLISSDACQNVLRELRDLGINRFSMFPELSSVGLIIKDSMA